MLSASPVSPHRHPTSPAALSPRSGFYPSSVVRACSLYPGTLRTGRGGATRMVECQQGLVTVWLGTVWAPPSGGPALSSNRSFGSPRRRLVSPGPLGGFRAAGCVSTSPRLRASPWHLRASFPCHESRQATCRDQRTSLNKICTGRLRWAHADLRRTAPRCRRI